MRRRQQAALGRGAAAPRPAPALLDQAVLQRVVGQVAVGLELQLLQRARPVGADRLHAEEHALGDLAHRLALGQAQEHLQLALGQPLRAAAGRPPPAAPSASISATCAVM